jgi:hypothetical protein
VPFGYSLEAGWEGQEQSSFPRHHEIDATTYLLKYHKSKYKAREIGTIGLISQYRAWEAPRAKNCLRLLTLHAWTEFHHPHPLNLKQTKSALHVLAYSTGSLVLFPRSHPPVSGPPSPPPSPSQVKGSPQSILRHRSPHQPTTHNPQQPHKHNHIPYPPV